MESKRIVVMGGSFNPPTLAHFKLMECALDALSAHMGLFVPVSDAYLRRKMYKSHPPVVLSEQMRLSMLNASCTDQRMEVCDIEIGTVYPQTFPTLMTLQNKYPDADIFFIMGSDKLKLLNTLVEKNDFLRKFKVLLFSRDVEDVAAMLESYASIAQFADRIVSLPQPADTEKISSSVVRQRMLAGESSEDLLCEGVWKLFCHYSPDDFPDVITRFSGCYAFLANSYSCRFQWEGVTYNNAEAAFQSSKCRDLSGRKHFSEIGPYKAASRGNQIEPPAGWKEQAPAVMESIVRSKFVQNPDLMQSLMKTSPDMLVNGNHKGDVIWGIDLYSWQGDNLLGEILMKVREEALGFRL